MSGVTLLFSAERGASSALIRWFTRSDYSHVDIVLPNGRLLGARLDGGVRIREPGYARFSRTLEVAAPSLIESARDRMLSFALGQRGKPYDWRAIAAFAFERDWREPSAWFCSELVAAAFEAAGAPLLNPAAKVNRIAPGDLLLSTMLRAVP